MPDDGARTQNYTDNFTIPEDDSSLVYTHDFVNSILYLKMGNTPTGQKKIDDADDSLAQNKPRG